MQEDAELDAEDSKGEIDQAQTEMGPPAIIWEAQDEGAAGVLRGGCRQPRHVRIAVDNPVEDHEVGRLHSGAGLHEITHTAIDAVDQPRLEQALAGGLLVGGRQLDIGGLACTCLQQLKLDRADAAPTSSPVLPSTPRLLTRSTIRRETLSRPLRRQRFASDSVLFSLKIVRYPLGVQQ